MKYLFFDCETTGTVIGKHHMFQAAGILTDDKLNTLETFDLRFRPHSLDFYEDGALEKTKVSLVELQGYELSSADAYHSLISIFAQHCNKFNKKDKIQFVAYNAPFDSDFLRNLFTLNNDVYYGSWFWNPPLCLMQRAAWLLREKRYALPDFKLGTLCQVFGINWEESEAHDALYDIQQSIELFKRIDQIENGSSV